MTPTYAPLGLVTWDRDAAARIVAARAAIRLGIAAGVDSLDRFRLFVIETRGSSPTERAIARLRYDDIGAACHRARVLERLHARRVLAGDVAQKGGAS